VEVWCATTWGQAAWTRTSRLIPIESVFTEDSIGTAEFALLRKARNEGDGALVDTFVPARGMYVVIVTGGLAGPFDNGEPLWAGRITDISSDKLQGYTDEVGSVSAMQLAGVLDQTPVRNLKQRDPSVADSGNPGLVLLTSPSANLVGANGKIIGNMWAGPGADGVALFESLAENCTASTMWDRGSLLATVLKYGNANNLLPPLSLDTTQDGVGTYLTTALSEVIRLDNLSLKQCIDLCVGQVRGTTWRVKATGSGWSIVVRSGTDVAVGTVPAQTATNVTLRGGDIQVALADGGDDVWDAVEVVGQPIVCMGTVSFQDGSMGRGWSASQEADFGAGATAAPDYAALISSGRIDTAQMRNQAVRKSSALQDVFARFVLTRNQPTTSLQCKGGTAPTSGTYAAASVPTQLLCPLIDWDGTTATVDSTGAASPYLPEAKLVHPLPWQSGVKGDGTDARTTEQQARPDYLKPMVFRYAPSDPIAAGWYEISHPPVSKGQNRWPHFSVELDGRGPALRIRTEYQEVLAVNHWLTSYGLSAADPNLSNTYGGVDWQNLFATVAVESDQRLKVTVYASGYDGVTNLPRNVLRIERPDLGCWLVRKYTLIGINNTQAPDEISADTFTRNDWAVAQRLANEAAAFAFRKRTGATITITKPWAPPAWAQVGTLLGTITDYRLAANGVSYTSVGSTTLNTIVNTVRQVWDPKRPRLIISTATRGGAVNMPMLIAQGVSPSLGGPMRAAVQRSRDDIADLQRTVQRIPVSVGQTSGGDGAASQVKVTQTAHGFTVGSYIARQSGGTWVTADNTGADYEPLARVMQVVDVNNVIIATEGVQYVPGNSYTDLKPSWLSTAGTTTETEVDGEAATAKTAKQIKRLAHIALTGGWIWLPGSSLRRAHNHDIGRLADVALSSPVVGDALEFDGTLWKNIAAFLSIGNARASAVYNANATHTFDASTKTFVAAMIGGGGACGFGHAASTVGSVTTTEFSGGGGAGELVIIFGKKTAATAAFVVGTAGVAGGLGSVGGSGGASTFTMNGVTVSAAGGTGGNYSNNGSYLGGAGGYSTPLPSAMDASMLVLRFPGAKGGDPFMEFLKVDTTTVSHVSQIGMVNGRAGLGQLPSNGDSSPDLAAGSGGSAAPGASNNGIVGRLLVWEH
jgi:hypothetical protein